MHFHSLTCHGVKSDQLKCQLREQQILDRMYTTSKKSKMMSQLQIQVDDNKKPRLKGIENIEGRVVVLCLTTWYFGFVFTECSPLSPTLVMGPQFGTFMSKEEGNGPCFGLVPFGAAVGVVLASCLIDKMSRRTFLVILNLINLLVTGLLQIGDVETLYIFRFCQGIVAGLFMTLVPTYISELTPKELGSRFGVYPQVSVVLGVLVAFTMGVVFSDSYGISKSTTQLEHWQWETFWRVQLGIGLVPSVLQLFFIAIGYIPESPHSLIVKNRKETAREVLALFYEDSFVDQMVEDRESAIFNKKSEMQESKVTWSSRGVTIAFVLSIMQVLSGIASFVTQAGHVISFTFNQTGIGLYTPVLITISQLIGTFVSIPMLKYFEWRKMTIIGGFSLAFLDAIIGMLFYLYESNGGTTSTGNSTTQEYILLVTCIAIMAFMFTFGMTLGSSVWPYISFMMPAHKVMLASVINWILAGLSIVAFSFVTAQMKNPYVMMFIYCGVTFILSIVFTCISINIKGLSVRKVQMQLQ